LIHPAKIKRDLIKSIKMVANKERKKIEDGSYNNYLIYHNAIVQTLFENNSRLFQKIKKIPQ
jgi:hypothetical protein